MSTIPDMWQDPPPPCPACGEMQWEKAGQAKDYSVSGEWFELLRCRHCGLKMTHPQPEEAKIGRYYASTEYISHSDTRKGLVNRLYHIARERMLEKKRKWVVSAYGKSSGRLLDVGAGTGYFAGYMKKNGWNVRALEPDETARQVAKEKHSLDIEPLPTLISLPPKSFDVITLWHVLEHVHDPGSYIDRCGKILDEGGKLIIAVPNYTSGDAVHYGKNWAAYDVPRHLWHFSPMSMKTLLARHQFDVEQMWSMPLDAFYVSMLSERYNGGGSMSIFPAIFQGWKSMRAGNKNPECASSVIYVARFTP